MNKLKEIVDDAIGELRSTLSSEQSEAVAKVIEAAVIRGVLEGQHRAVDACNDCGDAEQDLAHKVASVIRQKNDALIANLSSLR